MKIVQVIPSLIDGGQEKFVVDLSNSIADFDDEVIIISLYEIKETFFFNKLINPEVKIITLNKKKGLDIIILFKLIFNIIKIQPDIVHSHGRVFEYLIPTILLFRTPKYFHTVHNEAYKEAPNKLLRNIRRILYKARIIMPITISEESRKSFIQAYRIHPVQIDNGTRQVTPSKNVNEAKFKIQEIKKSSNTLVFINIARIEEEKNQLMLVKVFQKLIRNGFDVSLLIIGGIRHNFIYNDLLKYTSERILLLGSLENATDYLIYSDAFVLSSKWEGLPITVLEALSAKCIPICTPAGGLINAVTNAYNGFISKGFSEEDYYDALVLFLSLDSLSKEEMRQACLSVFNLKYSINRVTNEYRTLFLDSVKPNKNKG